MKEEKEQTSAVGNALTMMIELIIIRMMQPMKDMITELKSDVESIKTWCAEYISVEKFNELVVDMKDLKSDVELSIIEAINSINLPDSELTMLMIEEIKRSMAEKYLTLDGKIFELDELMTEKINKVEEDIEDNETNIEEIVSKLGLIGDILSD